MKRKDQQTKGSTNKMLRSKRDAQEQGVLYGSNQQNPGEREGESAIALAKIEGPVV